MGSKYSDPFLIRDIGANPKSQKTLDPLRTFTGHASPVEVFINALICMYDGFDT